MHASYRAVRRPHCSTVGFRATGAPYYTSTQVHKTIILYLTSNCVSFCLTSWYGAWWMMYTLVIFNGFELMLHYIWSKNYAVVGVFHQWWQTVRGTPGNATASRRSWPCTSMMLPQVLLLIFRNLIMRRRHMKSLPVRRMLDTGTWCCW